MRQRIQQVIDIIVNDKTQKGTRSAKREIDSFQQSVDRISNTLRGYIGLQILKDTALGLLKVSDASVNMSNRLKLVTNTSKEYHTALKGVVDISLATGSQIDANVNLLQRIKRPLSSLNFSLGQTVDLTKLFAEGMRISGASTQEASSTTIQFSQAMQSGVLRGQEYNAIVENGGRLALALADGIGVSIGELRKMAMQGELTAERVTKAFLSQSEIIAQENASMQLTIEQGWTNIVTKFKEYLSQPELQSGNNQLAKLLNSIAENFDKITSFAIPAMSVAILALFKKMADRAVLSAKEHASELIRQQAERKAIQDKVEAVARLERGKANASLHDRKRHSERMARTSLEVQAQRKKLQALAEEAILRARLARTRLKQEQYHFDRRQSTTPNGIVLKETKALTKAKRDLAIAEKNAIALGKALNKVRKEEVVIDGKLIDANIAYGASVNQVNRATKLNNASQRAGLFTRLADAIGLATTKNGKFTLGLGKSYVKGKSLAGLLPRIGGGLLSLGRFFTGWAGIAVYAIYEVVNAFYPLDKAIDQATGKFGSFSAYWQSFKLEVAKGVAFIVKTLSILSHPFDLEAVKQDIARYNIEIKSLEDQFKESTDKIIDDVYAQQKGFANANEENIKLIQENGRAIINANSKIKQHTDAQQEAFKKLSDLSKKQMTQEVEDFKKLSDSKIASIQQEYDVRVAMGQITEIDTLAHIKRIEAIEQQATKNALSVRDRYYKTLKKSAGKSARNIIAVNIKKHKAERAGILANLSTLRSAVKSMLSEYQRLGEKAEDFANKAKSYEQEASDYIKSIRDESLSDAEKRANSEQEYLDAIAEAKKANALDEIKDYKEITTLRESAQEKLKDYITTQTEIRDSATKGSLEEYQAQQNINTALDQYAKQSKSLATLNKLNADSVKDTQAIIKKGIDDRKELIKSYEDALAKLDKKIAIERNIKIDLDTSAIHKKLKDLNSDIDKTAKNLANLNKQRSALFKKKASLNKGGNNGTATGGFEPTNTQKGGYFTPYNEGGRVGDGDVSPVDNRLILAADGEYVLNNNVTSLLGYDVLDDINQNPEKYKHIERRLQGGRIGWSNPSATFDANRAGYTIEALADRGDGDSAVDRYINHERDRYEQYIVSNSRGATDPLSRNGSSRTEKMGDRIRQLISMLEELRDLPLSFARSGALIVSGMWSHNQGGTFDDFQFRQDRREQQRFRELVAEGRLAKQREVIRQEKEDARQETISQETVETKIDQEQKQATTETSTPSAPVVESTPEPEPKSTREPAGGQSFQGYGTRYSYSNKINQPVVTTPFQGNYSTRIGYTNPIAPVNYAKLNNQYKPQAQKDELTQYQKDQIAIEEGNARRYKEMLAEHEKQVSVVKPSTLLKQYANTPVAVSGNVLSTTTTSSRTVDVNLSCNGVTATGTFQDDNNLSRVIDFLDNAKRVSYR